MIGSERGVVMAVDLSSSTWSWIRTMDDRLVETLILVAGLLLAVRAGEWVASRDVALRFEMI